MVKKKREKVTIVVKLKYHRITSKSQINEKDRLIVDDSFQKGFKVAHKIREVERI